MLCDLYAHQHLAEVGKVSYIGCVIEAMRPNVDECQSISTRHLCDHFKVDD